MITIMLADDNKFALKHFAGLVNWEEFGFELIDTAIDGIEAWNKFCRLSPDVVITDVQMPGIDGRELAKRIKRTKPDTVVIFLSSYDEFDYARSAIDLSVQEYILKQELDKKTLEKKLGEIRQMIQNKKEKMRKMGQGHLINCFHTPLEDLDGAFYQDIFKESFGFVIFEQDHIPEILSKKSGYTTQEADHRTLLPKIQTDFPKIRYLIHIEPYRWLCFCEANTDTEQLTDQVIRYVEKESQIKVSVILFPEPMCILKCRRAYEKTKFLIEQKYFDGSSAVMYAEMYEEPRQYAGGNLDEFKEAFEKEQEEQTLRALDQMFRPIMHRYDFQAFERAVEGVLDELEKETKKIYGNFELYDESIGELFSVRRIVRWLKGKITEILEMKSKEHHFTPNAMERAVRFIYQEYSNSLLSVEEIAEKAGLSVNRLNDLFKKEQGETVGRFLTRVRMSKAKELLDKGEKIPDVSKKTGYGSTSYFARVFRKMYDISPQEYRRKEKRYE